MGTLESLVRMSSSLTRGVALVPGRSVSLSASPRLWGIPDGRIPLCSSYDTLCQTATSGSVLRPTATLLVCADLALNQPYWDMQPTPPDRPPVLHLHPSLQHDTGAIDRCWRVAWSLYVACVAVGARTLCLVNTMPPAPLVTRLQRLCLFFLHHHITQRLQNHPRFPPGRLVRLLGATGPSSLYRCLRRILSENAFAHCRDRVELHVPELRGLLALHATSVLWQAQPDVAAAVRFHVYRYIGSLHLCTACGWNVQPRTQQAPVLHTPRAYKFVTTAGVALPFLAEHMLRWHAREKGVVQPWLRAPLQPATVLPHEAILYPDAVRAALLSAELARIVPATPCPSLEDVEACAVSLCAALGVPPALDPEPVSKGVVATESKPAPPLLLGAAVPVRKTDRQQALRRQIAVAMIERLQWIRAAPPAATHAPWQHTAALLLRGVGVLERQQRQGEGEGGMAPVWERVRRLVPAIADVFAEHGVQPPALVHTSSVDVLRTLATGVLDGMGRRTGSAAVTTATLGPLLAALARATLGDQTRQGRLRSNSDEEVRIAREQGAQDYALLRRELGTAAGIARHLWAPAAAASARDTLPQVARWLAMLLLVPVMLDAAEFALGTPATPAAASLYFYVARRWEIGAERQLFTGLAWAAFWRELGIVYASLPSAASAALRYHL